MKIPKGLDDYELDVRQSRFQIQGVLGRGSFGEVFRALDTLTGDVVALKSIFIRNPEEGLPVNVLREYKGLQILQHKNIIRLLDVLVEGQSMVLVQELCATDMCSFLRALPTAVPPAIVKRCMMEILAGVQAIHAAGICHRDLKPSNLLLDAAGEIKIADFGLCRPLLPLGGQYSFSVPSKTYRAPELLFGCKEYDGRAVDMWSVGCILAELLGKVPLFEAEGEIQQLRAIMMVLGDYTPSAWGGQKSLPDYGKMQFPSFTRVPFESMFPDAPVSAVKLLERLLTYDPASRISAAEALRHPFFFEEPFPADAERMIESMCQFISREQ